MKTFYVYAYFDDEGVPIYIGKGTGSRMREHGRPGQLKRSDSFFYRKLKKMKREGRKWSCRKILTDLTEEESFFYERFFIAALGRRTNRTGPLCNSTDGGDRTNTGYRHSKTRRKKISKATRARWRDPAMRQEIRRRMRVGQRQREHRGMSPEARRQLNEKRFREKCRRLQAGCVVWIEERRMWYTVVQHTFISGHRRRTDAESQRVAACRAINAGRFEEFVQEVRDSDELARTHELAKRQKARHRRKMAKRKVWEARLEAQRAEKARREQQKKDDRRVQLEEKPWLVEAPYCVFTLGDPVEYVGCGRPSRIYKMFRHKAKRAELSASLLRLVDSNPVVRVVFVETRDQAYEWRRAWVEKYKPALNIAVRENKVLTNKIRWGTLPAPMNT